MSKGGSLEFFPIVTIGRKEMMMHSVAIEYTFFYGPGAGWIQCEGDVLDYIGDASVTLESHCDKVARDTLFPD